MANCPKCGKSLTLEHLDRFFTTEVYHQLHIHCGTPHYTRIREHGAKNVRYSCPYCQAVVARSEDKALKLLIGVGRRSEHSEWNVRKV